MDVLLYQRIGHDQPVFRAKEWGGGNGGQEEKERKGDYRG